MSAPSVAGAAPSVKARWAVGVAAGLLQTTARAQESTPYTFLQISQSFSPASDGPISLVLSGLTVNAILFAPSSTTTCAAPIGRPFVNVNVGGDAIFSRGERATASLEFVNPSGQPITFGTQLLAGPGQR